MTLPRFYPVLPDAAMLARLLPLGVKLVQLRFKGDADEIPAQIAASLALCARYGAQLVVNDHWQEALDLGASFIHLGQEDLNDADTAAIARAGARLGISTHDRAELDRALALRPAYVALGPIYQTKLKKMPWAPQGLEKLAEWKRLIGERPLVAIGGLTVERARLCLGAGADSVAVVSDIVAHEDPPAQVHAWLRATETVR